MPIASTGWRESLETVVRERDGWKGPYRARREIAA